MSSCGWTDLKGGDYYMA